MPDEVRTEIGPYFVDIPPVIEEDGRKLSKLDDDTAQYIRTGLTVSCSFLYHISFHCGKIEERWSSGCTTYRYLVVFSFCIIFL